MLIHHAEDASNWGTPHDTHACAAHHVAAWPGGSRLFGDARVRGVQLSFAPCSLAAATNSRTLAVHLELKGAAYADIVQRAEEMRDSKLVLPEHLGPPRSTRARLGPSVTVTATKKEKIIAAEALAGIGDM